jgi:hypothetical protein
MAKNNDKIPKSLVQQYKKLAAAADKQLQRLEKLAKQPKYRGVLQMAYAKAQIDIKKWRGTGKKRFGQSMPDSVQGVKAKIRDIRDFMDAPTYSKKGIEKFYESRATTLHERYGVEEDWQTLAIYYQRAYNVKFTDKYGSQNALKAIGIIQQHADEIMKNIAKHKKSDIRVEDPVVEEAVHRMLRENSRELRRMGVNI